MIMQKTNFEDIKDGYITFMDEWKNEHHRFRSYDPCKKYFDDHYGKNMTDEEQEEVYNECALRLFYYLASWGMIRNNDWFIWKSYKFFVPVVKVLFDNEYADLLNFGSHISKQGDEEYARGVKKLYEAVEEALRETLKKDDENYPPKDKGGAAEHKITRLMICKILMGTYGCVIAYDSYDQNAMRAIGVSVSQDLEKLLKNTYNIIVDHKKEFDAIMENMKQYQVNYTVFKVLDMILWEYGKRLGKTEEV